MFEGWERHLSRLENRRLSRRPLLLSRLFLLIRLNNYAGGKIPVRTQKIPPHQIAPSGCPLGNNPLGRLTLLRGLKGQTTKMKMATDIPPQLNTPDSEGGMRDSQNNPIQRDHAKVCDSLDFQRGGHCSIRTLSIWRHSQLALHWQRSRPRTLRPNIDYWRHSRPVLVSSAASHSQRSIWLPNPAGSTRAHGSY